MAKKAKPKQPAKPKGDGGKRAAKDQAAKTKRAATGTKAVVHPAQPEERTRKIWSGKSLRDWVGQVIIAQDRATKASGTVGQMITEKVKEKGVNAVALRLAVRVLKVALRDPNAGRVLYDDLMLYLGEDGLQVEKHCGGSMFKAREGAEDFDGDEAEEQPQEPQGDNVVNLNNGGNSNGEARPAA